MNQHLEPSSSLERELFLAALEKPTGAERARFLEGACRGEAPLRAAVEALLANVNDSLLDRVAEEARPTQTVPLSEGPGTQIGKFKILEQIGEGGFGVVYMAEQKEPVRRRVALKIIKLGMDTKEVVARFEAERQALALMDHPSIAKVLDAGATAGGEAEDSVQESQTTATSTPSQIVNRKSQIPAGRPYFVMELVKGRPITKFCDEERLSTVQRLELFICVCRAVQHAHQKGLVHRDLKPSNVLVSFVDGRPVPKIIDFGIAKAMQHDLTDKTVFTRFHQFMGTPAYMSPEQAGTDSADIDTRSDIYSLGVMLYELLTGRAPMDSHELAKADYDEIRRQIREVEPLRPSNRISTLSAPERTTVARSRSADPGKLSRLVCGDLDWIVLKAMEKDRNRRYETANEFAKDLQRYLDNEPVTARKPSLGYVFQKFARRHKVVLATAACFALLLIVSAGIAAAQAIKNKSLFTTAEEARLKEMNARQRETELRRIAETERDRSERLLYDADLNLAKRAWDDARVGRTLELLELHRPQPGQADLRNFEWFYLDRLCHRDLLTLKSHNDVVWSVAFSPDGTRLASAGGAHVRPAQVEVWDATTGQEQFALKGHTNGVYSIALSPDGKWLASAGEDRTVRVWDAETGRETLTLCGHTGRASCVTFSPDGKRLASASDDWTVRVWDTATGVQAVTLKGHTNGVLSVAFSPDGKRLASGANDAAVKLWDATSGQEILTMKGHTWGVTSVAFSPDGTRLASASWDTTVRVWDSTTGQQVLTLKGREAFNSVAFSPDGQWLATANDDQTVRLWNVSSGQERLTFRGHTAAVNSLAFSPDGKRLASAGDQTVRVWDALSNQETPSLKGHTGGVWTVSFSPDGQWLATAGEDTTVRVWDAATGQEKLVLRGHSGLVDGVTFSPDGRWLASASWDGTVRVWDATTGQEKLSLRADTNSVWGVAFSPDGKRLASTGMEGTIRLWDASSGKETLTLRGYSDLVRSVAFSPDGRRLVSAGRDQIVRVWDATSGQVTLTVDVMGVRSVTFSPDGKWLASAGQDETVRVWDASSGQQALTMKGHAGPVASVAFSPDGQRLATAGFDRIVRVWDTTSGRETLILDGHTGEVSGVAFSPDGQRLASASADQSVRLWDARPLPQASTPAAKTQGSPLFDRKVENSVNNNTNKQASKGLNGKKTMTQLAIAGTALACATNVFAGPIKSWLQAGNCLHEFEGGIHAKARGDVLLTPSTDGCLVTYQVWSAAPEYLYYAVISGQFVGNLMTDRNGKGSLTVHVTTSPATWGPWIGLRETDGKLTHCDHPLPPLNQWQGLLAAANPFYQPPPAAP